MFDNSCIRTVPGWEKAPVPICFGGDPRALTFCCDPGYPLAYEQKCSRSKMLREIGLSEEDYLDLKREFAKEMGWDDERVCFNSLSFCCLRRNGCPRRDEAVRDLCGSFEDYFLKKRVLALKILKAAKNKEKVEPYIKYEEDVLYKK